MPVRGFSATNAAVNAFAVGLEVAEPFLGDAGKAADDRRGRRPGQLVDYVAAATPGHGIERLTPRESGIGEVGRIEIPDYSPYGAEVSRQERTSSRPVVAPGTVVVKVQRGSMELLVDEELYVLNAGDWAVFDGTRAYRTRRTGGAATSYIYIVFGPTGYRYVD